MTAPGSDPADRAGQDITEQLLGQPRVLRRRDVSRGAEVSLRSARKFWHALGFPVIDTDDELFTEADRQALATVAGIVREGLLDEPTALAMTRAFARSADRLAGWQSQLIAEAVEADVTLAVEAEHDAPADLPDVPSGAVSTNAPAAPESRSVPGVATAAETARRLADLTDRLEPLLVYAWRRHLSATVSRMMADADPESFGLTKQRSVGFADLVNFTALVRRLSERDLARLVSRFEALSADVITAHGGRLIKTVGDEVLFTTVGAAPAAAIALDLVDTMTEDDVLPDVRCGMARGPIISRLGDVFGTTVNRASRLTAVAGAGSVLVDATMARELASMSGFELTGQRRRVLRGVGAVTPSVLRRASSAGRRAT
jgi:adenylate cyclase